MNEKITHSVSGGHYLRYIQLSIIQFKCINTIVTIRVSASKVEGTRKYLRSLIEVQIENYTLVNATTYIEYVI